MNWRVGIKVQTYRITITRRAKDDIIDISDYITYTLLEPDSAYDLVRGLRKTIASLNRLPTRYGLIDDELLANQVVRCVPYKNYYVFYEIVEAINMVVVLRIGYNRRNWKEIL